MLGQALLGAPPIRVALRARQRPDRMEALLRRRTRPTRALHQRPVMPLSGSPRAGAAVCDGGESDCGRPIVGNNGVVPRAVQLIRTSALSDVAGYAYAATAPKDARLLFLAGACPLDQDGTIAAAGDYSGQAARCIENMITALAAADATITDVISTRVLVASSQRDDLVTVWGIVREAFGDHDVPSTLMGVTMLGYADQLVEIEAIAAVVD